MNLITIPVAPSELLDKMTVLEINLEKLADPEKLKNVQREYDLLAQIKQEMLPASEELNALYRELKQANLEVFEALDEWFEYRKANKIDVRLAEILNKVQADNNEKRFPTKRKIDEFLHSSIREEKSYVTS